MDDKNKIKIAEEYILSVINSECHTGCRRDSEECSAENCLLRDFIDKAQEALKQIND